MKMTITNDGCSEGLHQPLKICMILCNSERRLWVDWTTPKFRRSPHTDAPISPDTHQFRNKENVSIIIDSYTTLKVGFHSVDFDFSASFQPWVTSRGLLTLISNESLIKTCVIIRKSKVANPFVSNQQNLVLESL